MRCEGSPLFATSVKLSLLRPILLEHKEHLKQKLTQIGLISQKTTGQNIQADWGANLHLKQQAQ